MSRPYLPSSRPDKIKVEKEAQDNLRSCEELPALREISVH